MSSFLKKVIEVGTATAISRIVWEEALDTEEPDYRLDQGEFRKLSIFEWNGNVVLFKINCPCGGESFLIPCLCESILQCIELVSRCKKEDCGRPLVAEVRFVLNP